VKKYQRYQNCFPWAVLPGLVLPVAGDHLEQHRLEKNCHE